MADFNWSWPTKIEREVIERALTLDFIREARNFVLVGQNGLGKTMIAQNICHLAVLAGCSVLFRTAAAIVEDLRHEMFNLRLQQASAQLEKPARLRTLRKDIARLETRISQLRNKAV